MLTIGRLAQASGVNLETIRYYERIGLLQQPPRTPGGHRAYEDAHRRRLTFIRRARELGFTIEQVRELLKLSDDDQPCGAVLALSAAHLEEVRRKLADLTRLEAILARAVSQCSGGAETGCPVLEMLAE
jgi:MerR family mercuric resistance operon transcriptional regulator